VTSTAHSQSQQFFAYQLQLQLQPFNGLFSRTTWVSRYQKGKTNLDFTTSCLAQFATCLIRTLENRLTVVLWYTFSLPVCGATQMTVTVNSIASYEKNEQVQQANILSKCAWIYHSSIIFGMPNAKTTRQAAISHWQTTDFTLPSNAKFYLPVSSLFAPKTVSVSAKCWPYGGMQYF